MGRALQPNKCFYSIISFEWFNRDWQYASNAQKGCLGITMLLLGGGKADAAHRLVHHAEKTLGVMTSPDGNSRAAIETMQERAQKWVNNVRNRHLHRRNVWFLLKVQLWPRIGYGICSSTATFQEFCTALHQKYYQILPLGGIVCTTTVETCTINSGFFGVGLLHLGVEELIAMSNKLLMHYGCDSTTGWFMQAFYSLFFLNWASHSSPCKNRTVDPQIPRNDGQTIPKSDSHTCQHHLNVAQEPSELS
jgi:hypothetical protein